MLQIRAFLSRDLAVKDLSAQPDTECTFVEMSCSLLGLISIIFCLLSFYMWVFPQMSGILALSEFKREALKVAWRLHFGVIVWGPGCCPGGSPPVCVWDFSAGAAQCLQGEILLSPPWGYLRAGRKGLGVSWSSAQTLTWRPSCLSSAGGGVGQGGLGLMLSEEGGAGAAAALEEPGALASRTSLDSGVQTSHLMAPAAPRFPLTHFANQSPLGPLFLVLKNFVDISLPLSRLLILVFVHFLFLLAGLRGAERKQCVFHPSHVTGRGGPFSVDWSVTVPPPCRRHVRSQGPQFSPSDLGFCSVECPGGAFSGPKKGPTGRDAETMPQ